MGILLDHGGLGAGGERGTGVSGGYLLASAAGFDPHGSRDGVIADVYDPAHFPGELSAYLGLGPDGGGAARANRIIAAGNVASFLPQQLCAAAGMEYALNCFSSLWLVLARFRREALCWS